MHHFLGCGPILASHAFTCITQPGYFWVSALALPELELIPSAFQDGIHVSNMIRLIIFTRTGTEVILPLIDACDSQIAHRRQQ